MSVMPRTTSTIAMPGGIAVHQMPLDDVADRLVEVVAPLGRGGRLDAEAEEAEGRERRDRLGRVERHDQRQRPGRVAQHVAGT